MGENSTTILNAITDMAKVKGTDIVEYMDADELIFYHALRTELDLLNKKPNQHSIDIILEHSRSLR